MVKISQIANYIEHFGDVFINKTFTQEEVSCSKRSSSPAEYLATRFAAKEALFKALAPLTEKGFDYRLVETLNNPDGSPYINVKSQLRIIMNNAGINNILISITTEADYAVAIIFIE